MSEQRLFSPTDLDTAEVEQRWKDEVSRKVNKILGNSNVVDATGAGDVVAQFNALLALLRTIGILEV